MAAPPTRTPIPLCHCTRFELPPPSTSTTLPLSLCPSRALQILMAHRYNFREHGTYTLVLHNAPASGAGTVQGTLVTDLPGNEVWIPALIALACLAGVALVLKVGKIALLRTMEVRWGGIVYVHGVCMCMVWVCGCVCRCV